MRAMRTAVLCTAFTWALSALAAPRYELETLPLLPGASLERIGAFNDQGQFAASWRLDGRRAGLTVALYTPGLGYENLLPPDLPRQSGGDFGAYDLNERGEVAALVNGNAYVLRAGGLGQAVPQTGGRYSGATAINDLGQVVGFREDPGGAYRAFAHSATAGFETLPFRNSLAEDINNVGQVLVDDGGGGRTRYWIYDLNTGGSTEVAPGLNPSPTALINDRGDVAFTTEPGDASRTFLWHGGVATAIDGLAGSIDDEVLDFNNLGQVLGRSIRGASDHLTWDPFIHLQGEGTFNLRSLIDPADLVGWEGLSVSRINDHGDIVGHGVRFGDSDLIPFILRNVAAPVPEPATWLLGLLGAGVVGVAGRRRRVG